MIVANIEIVLAGGFAVTVLRHSVGFDDVAAAEAEYQRVADLMDKRAERSNDVPKMIEINGAVGTKLSVPTDHISSVALIDFALANEHERGVRDAFPHLFQAKG